MYEQVFILFVSAVTAVLASSEEVVGCLGPDGSQLQLGDTYEGPSCTLYQCEEDGSFIGKACALSSGNNCDKVEDLTKPYPGCCLQLINCDEPVQGCQFDEENLEPGEQITGADCTMITCEADGNLTYSACGLVAAEDNCDMVQDTSKPYPECCVQFINCNEV